MTNRSHTKEVIAEPAHNAESTLKQIIQQAKQMQITDEAERVDAVNKNGMILISELDLDAAIRIAQGRLYKD